MKWVWLEFFRAGTCRREFSAVRCVHILLLLVGQFFDRSVNPRSVFTNSELSLKHINVYGFDYDFTLVQYTSEVMKLIYDESKRRLVRKLGVSVCVCVCLDKL